MQEVPTTRTHTDQFEEVRQLNVLIATLKSQKEIAGRECAETIEASENLRKQVGSLQELLAQLEQRVAEHLAFTKGSINVGIGVVRDVTRLVQAYTTALKEIDDKIEKRKQEFNEFNKETERAHLLVVKEQEEINRQWKELEVYKKRLEKHYVEHLPEHKFVV